MHVNIMTMALAVLICGGCAAAAPVQPATAWRPVNLRCEYARAPLGIETQAPRLSWQLQDARRGARQTAYRVLVADSPAALARSEGNVWDTGEVDSAQSIQLEYAGRTMESGARYWWKVRVWDRDGRPSPWSEPAPWEMGLLERSHWGARWIGLGYPEEVRPDPARLDEQTVLGEWIYPYNMIDRFEYWDRQPGYHLFRKTFEVRPDQAPRAARFSIQTDKPYKVWLNGEVLIDRLDRMDAARERSFNQELDHMEPPLETAVSSGKLQAGQNVLAVKLYKPEQTPLAAMRCGLRILPDGAGEGAQNRILSDRTWMATAAEDPEQPARTTPVPYIAELAEDWNRLSWENEHEGGRGIRQWYAADSSGYVNPLKNRRSIYLRKEFALEGGEVQRARLYVTALGVHEVWINGRRASRTMLGPGKGTYDHFHVAAGGAEFFEDPALKRRFLDYEVYDVTDHLCAGGNAIGAMLGNGWYNSVGLNLSYRKPLLLARLEVTYANGRSEAIVTDGTWRAHPSPVLLDSIHFGEVCDARLEERGWSEVEFDDSAWRQACEVPPAYRYHYAQSDEPELCAKDAAPIQVVRELKPVEVEKLETGAYLFHFDQVASGFVRLRVRDPEPGRRIKLEYGYKPGGINQRFSNQNEDVYVCRGDREEVWEKKFDYGLIRYVRVTGYPGEPTADDLVFKVIQSDFPKSGSFECSNDVVNDIWRALEWTFRGNYHSVPVDCDREKIYWPWAAGSFDVGAATWQFNLARFVPRMFRIGGGPGKNLWAAGWGEGAIFHPFRAWVFYGDRRFAEREYERMKFMMDRRTKDGPTHYSAGFGDWHGLNHKEKTGGMFGAVYHYGALWQLSRMAEWLGHQEDARRYREMLPAIARDFGERLLDEERMTFPGDNQRALALPLAMGFVPERARQQIEERFVHMVANCDEFLKTQESVVPTPYERLRQRCIETGGTSLDYHPTVGLYAQPVFLWSLTNIGQQDVAYRVITRTSYPSWGHMAREGTAIAEGYGAGYSHLGRTSIGGWIYETLGGIRPDPEHPGFKRFVVRPEPAGDLRWARATHHSPYGTIQNHWRIEGDGTFALDLTVPPNSTAVVYLPGGGAPDARVTEGGRPLDEVQGVRTVDEPDLPTYWWADLVTEGRSKSGATHGIYEVQAGRYSFRVSRP